MDRQKGDPQTGPARQTQVMGSTRVLGGGGPGQQRGLAESSLSPRSKGLGRPGPAWGHRAGAGAGPRPQPRAGGSSAGEERVATQWAGSRAGVSRGLGSEPRLQPQWPGGRRAGGQRGGHVAAWPSHWPVFSTALLGLLSAAPLSLASGISSWAGSLWEERGAGSARRSSRGSGEPETCGHSPGSGDTAAASASLRTGARGTLCPRGESPS